jgi:hypothetical protein
MYIWNLGCTWQPSGTCFRSSMRTRGTAATATTDSFRVSSSFWTIQQILLYVYTHSISTKIINIQNSDMQSWTASELSTLLVTIYISGGDVQGPGVPRMVHWHCRLRSFGRRSEGCGREHCHHRPKQQRYKHICYAALL